MAAVAAASAPAAPLSSSITVNVLLGTTNRDAVQLPRGGSGTVGLLRFKLGMSAENIGTDPATVHVRLELPAGLHWGTDLPDPSESCASTATTADCNPAQKLDANDFNFRSAGWLWDVTADAPGAYVVKADLVEASPPDADPSDNSATVTINVTQAVKAGAVKVSPARPKAGSVVSARVAVTAGGEAVAPTGVSCTAAIGAKKIGAKARPSLGAATCLFRTPRGATGRTLRGAVGFTVNDTNMTRRFAVKLR